MQKNRIDANVRCPSCNGQLYPRVLVCDACGLKVEGEFVMNEFGSLTPDELHFLRVFINCEGRIRDMEAALGVSYPTVKTHLTAIKDKLRLSGSRPDRGRSPEPGRGRSLEPVGARSPEPARPPVAPPVPEPPGTEAPGEEAGDTAAEGSLAAEEILDRLDSGKIAYKEAVRLLRALKKKGEEHGDKV